jgi:hypothetical protein
MLAGSRDATWSASEPSFSRQWDDPVVGPEIRALGFERPEQIGAQFLADADILREFTRHAEPLVDDFPKRLTDERKLNDRDVRGYSQMMNVNIARSRFSNSSFIREAWPERLRKETPRYFEWSLRGTPTHRSLGKDRWHHLKRVHRTLVETSLRVPALWELGTNDDELNIVERLAARGESSGLQQIYRGWGALADRDFARAAEYFERAEALNAPHRALPQYRLYAMCMSAQHEEAEAFATTTMPRFSKAAKRGVCNRLENILRR